MKTAMKEHINDLERAKVLTTGLVKEAIEACIENALLHSPKERQQIFDAWDEGANGAMDTKTATDYFTQKYEQ